MCSIHVKIHYVKIQEHLGFKIVFETVHSLLAHKHLCPNVITTTGILSVILNDVSWLLKGNC